jgi:predicted TIM-barrel fold metal-dependent hydrolase
MAKNGFKIMDCDIHVAEPPDLWAKHLEPAYRDQAPQRDPIPPAHLNSDLEIWRFAGRAFPAYIEDPRRRKLAEVRAAKAATRHVADGRYQKKEEDLRGDDPRSMLKAMDVEGVDVSIVFRTLAAHFIAVDGLAPELSAAMCRAFNNWLAEFCSVDATRLRPAALLPLQDTALAVEEAKRAVRELGAVALVLSNHPVNQRPWYDRSWDPIWSTAEKLRVPIAFHGIQNAYQDHLGRRYIDNFAMAHACGHPVEQMLALGCLLTGGVFERFPGLRAAFVEASCSWVPAWLWCLDERVEKFADETQFSLTRSPTEMFAEHCFVACDPDETVLRHTLPALGDSNIVISTDWPHDDSGYPHAIDTFLALEGVSQESKRKILWDNCMRLYGIA